MTFSVALLLMTLPLAAQVTRVDLVVTDAQGNRVRGLDAADFVITVNNERRAIESFEEFSGDAKATPAVTDTAYVSLVPVATPTPPRRIVLMHGVGASEEAAKAFAEKNRRPGDEITFIDDTSPSRIATAIVELARHPGKKAVVVFGHASTNAAGFARRRGVALYDQSTLVSAAEDLTSYYSLTFRSSPTPVQIRSTRQNYTVRPVSVIAPLPLEDTVSDAVIAQHAGIAQPNDLGIRVTAEPLAAPEGEGRKIKLHVLIPIDNLTLTRERGELKGGFDVYLSTGNDDGEFSPITKRTHTIDWPAGAREQAGQTTIDFTLDVVMAAGRRRISVGVVDQGSKKSGYQLLELPR